ncbi:MAG: hypothetical protein EP330_13735 [Deltaproteobacteria bacterium]|nr:MAG: hypothetical protein EP330_13735 [Deltaproteobacteria bacterium]
MKLRDELQRAGLRATTPRLQVLEALDRVHGALSSSELQEQLPEMDRVTLYRNLQKLGEVGLIAEVSAGRWELADQRHPHFLCVVCGDLRCLPPLVVHVEEPGNWAEAIALASVQLRGSCPDCLGGDA